MFFFHKLHPNALRALDVHDFHKTLAEKEADVMSVDNSLKESFLSAENPRKNFLITALI